MGSWDFLRRAVWSQFMFCLFFDCFVFFTFLTRIPSLFSCLGKCWIAVSLSFNGHVFASNWCSPRDLWSILQLCVSCCSGRREKSCQSTTGWKELRKVFPNFIPYLTKKNEISSKLYSKVFRQICLQTTWMVLLICYILNDVVCWGENLLQQLDCLVIASVLSHQQNLLAK